VGVKSVLQNPPRNDARVNNTINLSYKNNIHSVLNKITIAGVASLRKLLLKEFLTFD
jgi:hypothetical protein